LAPPRAPPECEDRCRACDPEPSDAEWFDQIARNTAEVGKCYHRGGQPPIGLYLRPIDDLEEVLDRFTAHELTTTSIIHSASVPRRGQPVGGD